MSANVLVLALVYNQSSTLCSIVAIEEVFAGLQAAAEGPRASERFAAVVAAFVSALTGISDAQGIGANFTAALTARLEDASLQDQSLACANLAAVLAHLYLCALLPASTIYSFLHHLTNR